MEPQVLCTDFARQAAERLFDEHGRLDQGAIRHLLDDVDANTQLPAHHRQNLKNTLNRMARSPELANTLNSICAQPGTSLKGPAADLVRATLNLPPGEQHLDAVHARKAAAMAMLGNLRQGKVGSCFATSVAICLHEDSPEVVARDMKTLLETNKLVFDRNGVKFDMPLNKRISTGDLDIEMMVRADGTCHGKLHNNDGQGVPYKLHQTPGMQAALTALGIAQPMMEQELAKALQQMGLAGHTTYRVSKRSIIEHIARTHADPAQPAKGNPLASALNAYAGREDVRLLRAWEYTMAGAAEIDYQASHIDKFSSAALFGPDIAGRPELASLARHTGALGQQLAADPRFRSTPLNAISTHLFNDIQQVMKDRFMLQYDADIRQSTISGDGVSNRGGFVLHDRFPANDPSKWVRIDDPKMFQHALANVVAEAASHTGYRMQGAPGDPQANQAALQAYVQHLGRQIHTDAFIELTARNMNPSLAREARVDLNQCEDLPWKQARGADSRPVVRQYGGNKYFVSPTLPGAGSGNQTNALQAPGMGGPGRPGDATPVLNFLFDSVRAMKPELMNDINQPGAKLPVGNSLHAFALFPSTFKDALQYEGVTSQQWIQHHLTTPAMQHVALVRTEPALENFISQMSTALRMQPGQAEAFRNNLARQAQASGLPPQRYTLAMVHQEMQNFCAIHQNPAQREQLSAIGESVITRLAPTPGVIIADTNWSDAKGNPKPMLAVQNPFRNRMELHVADFDGTNRIKLGDNWVAGQWLLSTPIGKQQAASR